MPNELRQPLPASLQATQQQAYRAYLTEFGGDDRVYLPLVNKSE